MCQPTESSEPARELCGTMQHHQRLLAEDPTYRYNRQNLENVRRIFASARINLHGALLIPCIFHIIGPDPKRITDAQVDSQLQVLNEDFGAKNTDITGVPSYWKDRVGNAGIGFFRVTRDQAGNDHSGIIRVTNPNTFMVKSGSSNTDMMFKSRGGSDAWPRDRYLNIWVCNVWNEPTPDNPKGESLLGFAQFPGGAGGPFMATDSAKTDGVVIHIDHFGRDGTAKFPFNLGRTATHEVGHWLNLRHIWGDDHLDQSGRTANPTLICSGDDFVADTPNCAGPNYQRPPKVPWITCDNGPNGDMFMNHMDYNVDREAIMFTKGQVERMKACIYGYRSALCIPTFSEMLFSTSTTFASEELDQKILVGDILGTKKLDMLLVKFTNGTSHEVHLATGSSGYVTREYEKQMPYTWRNAGECDYCLAKWPGFQRPCLFLTQRPESINDDRPHIFMFAGDDDFQSRRAELIPPVNVRNADYTFLVGPYTRKDYPDLWIIQRNNTQFGRATLQIYTGHSNFKTLFDTIQLPIDNVGPEVEFLLADYNGDGISDLVIITKSKDGDTKTKLDILAGQLQFQTYLALVDLPLVNTAKDWDFQMGDFAQDGRVDLLAVKKNNTQSGRMDMFVYLG